MSQYFENNPNLKSIIKEIQYTYYGKVINYRVDLGVFSKDRVDFGSNVLLQTLPKFSDEKILDMGCGYGTIGLAIAKAFPKTDVLMCDVNLRAIELTQTNILLNKINNAKVIESNTYEHVKGLTIQEGKFDYIISNPPIRAGKKVVHDICLNAINYLNDGGKAIFVIRKKQGADSLKKAMTEIYSTVEVLNKANGYLILQGIK